MLRSLETQCYAQVMPSATLDMRADEKLGGAEELLTVEKK